MSFIYLFFELLLQQ